MACVCERFWDDLLGGGGIFVENYLLVYAGGLEFTSLIVGMIEMLRKVLKIGD